MHFLNKAAKSWARLMYSLSKLRSPVFLLVLGIGFAAYSLHSYFQERDTVALVLALVFILMAIISFERLGFVLWIDDLKRQIEIEDRVEVAANQAADRMPGGNAPGESGRH